MKKKQDLNLKKLELNKKKIMSLSKDNQRIIFGGGDSADADRNPTIFQTRTSSAACTATQTVY